MRRMVRERRAHARSPTASAATSTPSARCGLGARPSRATRGRSRCEWNAAADPAERGRYESTIGPRRPQPRDRPAAGGAGRRVRAARRASRRPRSRRASTTRSPRRPRTLVRGARASGRATLPVVLTGGCFQNARLDRANARARSVARVRGASCIARSRRATAASRWARPRSPRAVARTGASLMCLGVPGRVVCGPTDGHADGGLLGRAPRGLARDRR